MSVVDNLAIDCVHQRGGSTAADHHRLSSKRKLDDSGGPHFDEDGEDDDYVEFLDFASRRMRKDSRNAGHSSSDGYSDTGVAGSLSAVDDRVSEALSEFFVCSTASVPTPSFWRLQFFVRMISEGKTMVLHGYPDETVKSLHERIQSMTGIPVFEQRLIYRGRQLQWEQSLAECSIQNDASLQLVGRMRSTEHPQAWQVAIDMVAFVCRLCRGEIFLDAPETMEEMMDSYLSSIPRQGCDSVSDYFQIFLCSSAPAVLVMLYMSPLKGNKECAEYSIKHFLNICHCILSKPSNPQCAQVVLEFCKLLRRLGSEDSLYLLCRSTLGALLEKIDISRCNKNVNGRLLTQEIFPFVCELANSLLKDLDSSMKSPHTAGPSATDVLDFTFFLLSLRKAARMEQVPFLAAISVSSHEKRKFHGEEIERIDGMCWELIDKMDECLQQVEKFAVKDKGEDDVYYPAWSQYINILKELNNLSKLYEGAESKFWSVLALRRRALCLLIIKYAKRTDDHRWILENKDVTDFESRRHLVMMMFPEVKDDYEDLHEMLIDRSQLLAESFQYIARADAESLHGGLFLEFKNEEATGPGVLREWFFLICQAIFDPQNALFEACPNDRRRFFPNPTSKVDPLHLDYFTFSGRVVALALMHKVQVGIVFDRIFFSRLAGNCVTLEDIRDADPCLYNSCKQILEMDADFIDSDALELTFVREVEELGYRRTVELCPGGKNLTVNSKNRETYVHLLIQDHFVTSISEQVFHFADGFSDILCDSRLQKLFFRSLELQDLDQMLYGTENTISIEDWKAHTDYNGYKETDSQICWFWEIVGGMSAEQRKVLLFFWTSVKYLPAEGFRGLASRLTIYRTSEPHDRLPSSHTCFYGLCFPPYPSISTLQDRLQIITQEHVSCSFGTW